MQVITERFGPIEVDDGDVFDVPEGIPGFPELRRVALLGAGSTPGQDPVPDTHTLFWMQSLDQPDLAFLCIQPWDAFPDYDFEFDGSSLGVEDTESVSVLNLVTVRRVDGRATMSANLRAPLVLDLAGRRLHQVILSDQRWAVNVPFATTPPAPVAALDGENV